MRFGLNLTSGYGVNGVIGCNNLFTALRESFVRQSLVRKLVDAMKRIFFVLMMLYATCELGLAAEISWRHRAMDVLILRNNVRVYGVLLSPEGAK